MNILFLFAPKFKEFGVDVAKKLMSDHPDLSLVGLCTGGPAVVDYIKNNLDIESDRVCDLELMEKQWMLLPSKKIDYEYLKTIDEKYGSGTVGEVITADRRIGIGSVRGGIARPDSVGDEVSANNVDPILKYVQGLFSFIEDVFGRYGLSGVFCYAVAGAPAVALGKVCKLKGGVFTRLTATRIGNRFVVDTDYKGLLEPISTEFNRSQSKELEWLADAESFVDRFRDSPVLPGYAVRNHAIAKKNKLPELFKSTALYIAAIVAKPILPSRIKYRVSVLGLRRKLFEFYSECRKLTQRRLIGWKKLPEAKYVYYPLHVDPEASTMVLSPMHTDQISIIESVSKSLPGDTLLVVKEHLPMLGKRPKGFYEALQKLPRVLLVRPDLNGHEIINASQGVVVITGTSALEALLLGKKALVIGDSPYLPIGNRLLHEPSLHKLPHAIQALCNSDSLDDASLIRYIAIVLEQSFELNASLMWGSYLSHSESERLNAVSELAQGIYSRVANG